MIPTIEYVKSYTALDIFNEKKKILSDEIIDDYTADLRLRDNKTEVVHKCRLSLINIDLSLVNTLRRIVLAYIPIVAFSEINIIENNTSLINEFLEKRLNLISVSMQTLNNHGESYNLENDNILKSVQLKSSYNKIIGIREYEFNNPEVLPKFNINKYKDSSGYDYITSFNINYNEEEDPNHFDKKLNYLNPDLFSNDYDVITKLKEDEKINIDMKLGCGIGFINVMYSSVGTISVKPTCINKIEDIESLLAKIEDHHDESGQMLRENLNHELQLYSEAFKSYKDSIVKERLEKGLLTEDDLEEPFDEEEFGNIKHDFDTLIRPRIYPNNYKGNSTSYVVNIETNNNLKAEQIFLDALAVLYINISDLKTNIKSSRPKSYNENEFIKISINQTKSNNYELIIENENHTLGNLLKNYLNLYNDQPDNEYKLEFISYTQPHPLINNILFKFITNLGQKTIFKIFNETLNKIHLDIASLGEQYLEVLKSQFNYEELEHIYPDYIPKFMSYASFRVDNLCIQVNNGDNGTTDEKADEGTPMSLE